MSCACENMCLGMWKCVRVRLCVDVCVCSRVCPPLVVLTVQLGQNVVSHVRATI